MGFQDHEIIKKTGATLALALAVGAVAAGPVEAHPAKPKAADTPEHIDNTPKLPQAIPKGVHALVNEAQIQQEANMAFSKLSKRWNGVMVLHAPKKNAAVVFADSPSSYHLVSPDLGFSSREGSSVLVCVQPGIEKIKGRDYAAIYDMESYTWAFLDIKWAQENGALTTYAFTDSAPRPIAYNPSKQAGDLPIIDWRNSLDYPGELQKVTDSKGKVHHLKPSSTVPHS